MFELIVYAFNTKENFISLTRENTSGKMLGYAHGQCPCNNNPKLSTYKKNIHLILKDNQLNDKRIPQLDQV